jgi:hypothetical protein
MSVEYAAISDSQTTSRRETKAVVTVRLWIAWSKDSHLAHTLDVSNHGVRLGGWGAEMKVGDKIEIQYRQKNAKFRVAWITAGTGSARQIGAECLEPGKQVWGEPFI